MTQNISKAQSEADIAKYEGTPLSERLNHISTYDMLKESALKHLNDPCFTFLVTGEVDETPVIWSYKDMLANLHQAANLFHFLGLKHNEAVANLLPIMPESYSVIFGGQAQGVSASINPILDTHHIAGILKASGAKILVTVGPMPELGLWEKACELANTMGTLTHIIALDLGKYYGLPKPSLPETVGSVKVISFDDAIKNQPHDRLVSNRVFKSSETAGYFHTGGTTGVPKLAIHTHENQVFQSWFIGQTLELKPENPVLCGLPLFHVFGAVAVGIATLCHGVNMVLATPSGFRTPALIQNFWHLTDKHKITFLAAVPTVYTVLGTLPIGDNNISSLVGAFTGAAPMAEETRNRFQKHTGIRIFEGYGMTEATAALTINPMMGNCVAGSIGLRVPYTDLKVVGLDDDGKWTIELPTNEQGMLLARGPTIFPGYKQEGKNKDAFTDDGWLITGDLVRVDDDGYYWITGRAKDVIIRAGHNIDPSIIEETLVSHPSISMAAAIGEPDLYVGEVPVAYVTLGPGQTASEEELLDYCTDKIQSGPEQPRFVNIIPEMPQTTVGKIYKPDLRVISIKKVFTDTLTGANLSAEISHEMTPNEGLVIHVKPSTKGSAQEIKVLLGQYVTPFVLDNHS
jgi:fatty-acyl-CoA synthase